ncbi:MAG: PocR ligand-binding domain-containing protein [Candidatus Schekmanbacteria bacterium]|nr:PocR ligand-binding domain-containing protein [Candidatus Schekmanbacteria bacterium]
MDYKLEDIIDVILFQELQEKLNLIYSFPSAIIDNDGKILTAVAWQDICTKFHRVNPQSEKECLKSDKYIIAHLHEANPAVSYQCPHGMIDNAAPIIIDGKHLGNFFTGQFFLEKPDLDFYKKQAKAFGFDEKTYLEAVEKVPIWTKEKLNQYLDFIKGFIELIANVGLKNLKEIEARAELNKTNEELAASRIAAITLMKEAVEAKNALEIANEKLLEEIAERKRAEEELKKYRDHLETLVRERTAELEEKNTELERINKLFVGRELRMIELKDRIKELESKS